MKKRICLKAFACLTSFSSLIYAPAFMLGAKAYENVVTSPIQGVKVWQSLTNNTNGGFVNNAANNPILAYVKQKDNKYEIKFNDASENADLYSSYMLDDPGANMLYFAVFKDRITGNTLGTVPINSMAVSGHNEYSCNYTTPPNVDMVDVLIYKQSSSQSSYVPMDSNFVGKLRLFNASNTIYLRQNSSVQIKGYNASGEEINSGYYYYYNRLVPNLFSFCSNLANVTPTVDLIGQIEITNGQGQMSATDKIVSNSFFKDYIPVDVAIPAGTQVVPGFEGATNIDPSLFNFYLPDGVSEFTFKIYKGSIASENLHAQFNINLNRS